MECAECDYFYGENVKQRHKDTIAVLVSIVLVALILTDLILKLGI